MFILRLTSDPSLHGLETDDGFIIGSLTSSTIFLVAICTILGLVGGVLYLIARSWLPRPKRALYTATFAGIVGAAMIIKPDGIDFTLVEPVALSVPMFILLPALYGAALSLLTERFLAKTEASGSLSKLAFLPLLGLGLIGPFGILVLALGFVAWTLGRRVPASTELWRSAAVTWIGRTGLAAIAFISSVNLFNDLTKLF
jgi:hypothetical protein